MRKGVQTKQNKKEKANGGENIGVIKNKAAKPRIERNEKMGANDKPRGNVVSLDRQK